MKRPGEVTLPLLDRWLDGMVEVEDDAIVEAMVFVAERAKLITEGAGAVAVAALLTGAVEPAKEGATAAVLSGGNVDPGSWPPRSTATRSASTGGSGSSHESTIIPAAWPTSSRRSPTTAPTSSRSPTSAIGLTST